ncbi:MAG TPA: hypothetical protein VK920_10730 [Solirubrobacterales bacterium]|nr:hypothetical protein [Solirubrobacterales bacterium]
MGRNGKRRPPRPRIGAVTPAPSHEEAAAIAAAIERFLAETAPAPAPEVPASRWSRAALEEGVRPHAGGAWGTTPSRRA